MTNYALSFAVLFSLLCLISLEWTHCTHGHGCVGTGRPAPNKPLDAAATGEQEPIPLSSLRMKMMNFVESATDTEVVHRLLQDLLPRGAYFRINPTVSEWLALDETRQEKIDQLKMDGLMYLRRNDYKMQKVSQALSVERSYFQRARDAANYHYQMYKRKWP